MTKEEEFERLKENAIASFLAYTGVIEKLSIDNLYDSKIRMQLIDEFVSSTAANAALAQFLTDHAIKI